MNIDYVGKYIVKTLRAISVGGIRGLDGKLRYSDGNVLRLALG